MMGDYASGEAVVAGGDGGLSAVGGAGIVEDVAGVATSGIARG
jgi:hypothetical protein